MMGINALPNEDPSSGWCCVNFKVLPGLWWWLSLVDCSGSIYNVTTPMEAPDDWDPSRTVCFIAPNTPFCDYSASTKAHIKWDKNINPTQEDLNPTHGPCPQEPCFHSFLYTNETGFPGRIA
jgi:hypothetical protein